MKILSHLRQRFALPSEDVPASGGRDAAALDRELLLVAGLESAGDGCGLILVKDKGNIVWFNEPSRRWFALSRARDIGENITHLIRNPTFLERFKQGNFGEMMIFREINPGLSAGISILPWSADYRLIIVHDFSQRQRLEDSGREIMANLSHELRSPLTVIKGYLDTLSTIYDSGKDKDISAALRNMLKQCVRMQQLVEDTLLLGRLETSEVRADELETVDIPLLVDGLTGDLQEVWPGREIEISGERHSMNCIRADIYSVLSNLLSNALNYSGADSTVRLEWHTRDDGFYFAVTDRGIGIEATHIPYLSERFYRVDKARSNATGGVGLGLAIVARTLDRYGARLRIDSEYGVGSTFSCIFPREHIVR